MEVRACVRVCVCACVCMCIVKHSNSNRSWPLLRLGGSSALGVLKVLVEIQVNSYV